VLHMK